jgi:hypothetical protein
MARHVTWTGETRKCIQDFGKKPLWEPRRRWEDKRYNGP